MKTFFSSLFFIALLVFSQSCKSPDSKPSGRELIAKTWRTSQISLNGSPDQSTVYDSFRWQFGTDGQYTFTQGSGQVLTGTWQLSSNDTVLILDAGTQKERQATIQQLTSTNFNWTLVTKDYKQGDINIVLQLVPA
jgi:hypothetical protein